SYQTRNAPPPMPDDCGSTSPSTVCTAISASAALPPSRNISRPASAASGCAATTMRRSARTTCLAFVPVAISGATASVACCAYSGPPETSTAASAATSPLPRTSLSGLLQLLSSKGDRRPEDFFEGCLQCDIEIGHCHRQAEID